MQQERTSQCLLLVNKTVEIQFAIHLSYATQKMRSTCCALESIKLFSCFSPFSSSLSWPKKVSRENHLWYLVSKIISTNSTAAVESVCVSA